MYLYKLKLKPHLKSFLCTFSIKSFSTYYNMFLQLFFQKGAKSVKKTSDSVVLDMDRPSDFGTGGLKQLDEKSINELNNLQSYPRAAPGKKEVSPSKINHNKNSEDKAPVSKENGKKEANNWEDKIKQSGKRDSTEIENGSKSPTDKESERGYHKDDIIKQDLTVP